MCRQLHLDGLLAQAGNNKRRPNGFVSNLPSDGILASEKRRYTPGFSVRALPPWAALRFWHQAQCCG